MVNHKENINKIMLMHENSAQVIGDYVTVTEKESAKNGFKRGVYTTFSVVTLVIIALKFLIW
jgi:hypothetical protein